MNSPHVTYDVFFLQAPCLTFSFVKREARNTSHEKRKEKSKQKQPRSLSRYCSLDMKNQKDGHNHVDFDGWKFDWTKRNEGNAARNWTGTETWRDKLRKSSVKNLPFVLLETTRSKKKKRNNDEDIYFKGPHGSGGGAFLNCLPGQRSESSKGKKSALLIASTGIIETVQGRKQQGRINGKPVLRPKTTYAIKTLRFMWYFHKVRKLSKVAIFSDHTNGVIVLVEDLSSKHFCKFTEHARSAMTVLKMTKPRQKKQKYSNIMTAR